jgi:uncharacterized protein YjbJ (UPF0337 family)
VEVSLPAAISAASKCTGVNASPSVVIGAIIPASGGCVAARKTSGKWLKLEVQQGQSIVNKDQVKGAAKIVAGKIQEETGNLIGSDEQIVKGVKRQIAGKKLKGRGDVKEIVEDFIKEHPGQT